MLTGGSSPSHTCSFWPVFMSFDYRYQAYCWKLHSQQLTSIFGVIHLSHRAHWRFLVARSQDPHNLTKKNKLQQSIIQAQPINHSATRQIYVWAYRTLWLHRFLLPSCHSGSSFILSEEIAENWTTGVGGHPGCQLGGQVLTEIYQRHQLPAWFIGWFNRKFSRQWKILFKQILFSMAYSSIRYGTTTNSTYLLTFAGL